MNVFRDTISITVVLLELRCVNKAHIYIRAKKREFDSEFPGRIRLSGNSTDCRPSMETVINQSEAFAAAGQQTSRRELKLGFVSVNYWSIWMFSPVFQENLWKSFWSVWASIKSQWVEQQPCQICSSLYPFFFFFLHTASLPSSTTSQLWWGSTFIVTNIQDAPSVLSVPPAVTSQSVGTCSRRSPGPAASQDPRPLASPPPSDQHRISPS